MLSIVIEHILDIVDEDEITKEDELANLMLQYSYQDEEDDSAGHT